MSLATALLYGSLTTASIFLIVIAIGAFFIMTDKDVTDRQRFTGVAAFLGFGVAGATGLIWLIGGVA